jgi:hypothetical protein
VFGFAEILQLIEDGDHPRAKEAIVGFQQEVIRHAGDIIANNSNVPVLIRKTLVGVAGQECLWVRFQSFKHRHDHLLTLEFEMLNVGRENDLMLHELLKDTQKGFLFLGNPRLVPNEWLCHLLDCADLYVSHEVVHQATDEAFAFLATAKQPCNKMVVDIVAAFFRVFLF